MSYDRASSSTRMFSDFADAANRRKPSSDISSDKSYEIFRNNTTSVEVIVKEIPKKRAQCSKSDVERLQDKQKRLEAEIRGFENKADRDKGVGCIVFELKKQLEITNARELNAQTENIALKLENEKLKTLLQSKEAYTNKLKRELLNMRRMIKVVVKGILNAPPLQDSTNSDPEYEKFERDLLKNFNLNFPLKNSLEVTNDSSLLENSRTTNLSSPVEKR